MSLAEFSGCQSDGRYYDKSTVRNDHPGCEGSQMRFYTKIKNCWPIKSLKAIICFVYMARDCAQTNEPKQSPTEHQSRLGIVRVSFEDVANYMHNLNLAPTLIISSTYSKPRNRLT